MPEWRERAVQLGLTPELVRALGGRVRSAPLPAELVEEIAEWLAGPTGLTRAARPPSHAATCCRRSVSGYPQARASATRDVERLADEFLRVAARRGPGGGRAPRVSATRRRAVIVRPRRSERIYSTPELLALERRDPRLRGRASRRAHGGRAATGDRAGDQAAPVAGGRAGRDGAPPHRRRRRCRGRRRPRGHGQDVRTRAPRARRGRRAAGASTAPRWRGAPRASSKTTPASRARASRRCSTRSTRRPYSTLRRALVLVARRGRHAPHPRARASWSNTRARLDVKLVLVGDHRQLAGDRRGRCLPRADGAAAGDRAAGEPPPARAVGARRAAARARRRRARGRPALRRGEPDRRRR